MQLEELIFFVIIIAVPILGTYRKQPRLWYRHLRGTRLTALWRVRQRLNPFQDSPETFVWGRFRVPVSLAFRHILVAGSTGSGKTLLLRLLMQSVFPRIGQGESHRALVYDGKDELLEIILGMRQPYQAVITLDPFDAEGAAWDIAGDVIDDASANQIARLLFPKQGNEHQPFYPESVQNLASAVMQALHERAPGQWRLSHLLFVLRSTERIRSTLSLTQKGSDLLEQFFNSGETWGNISATLSNRLNDYEVVAGLWDIAPHSISMREWNRGESILVLRKHHQCSDVVDAINRVVIACAKRNLLSTPENPKRRTWIILDEAASLGKGIGKELTLLMEQGRSRNISVALGFQSLASMRDELGTEGADRLIAQASVKALLRFEDHASAEWAAGFFGKQEVAVKTNSATDGHSGYPASQSSSQTFNITDRERWTVLPSEFQAIPTADKRNGLAGFYVVPYGKSPMAYFDKIRPRWLFHSITLAPMVERVAPTRPTSAQRLSLKQSDLDRLLGVTPSVNEVLEQPSNTVESKEVTPPSIPLRRVKMAKRKKKLVDTPRELRHSRRARLKSPALHVCPECTKRMTESAAPPVSPPSPPVSPDVSIWGVTRPDME